MAQTERPNMFSSSLLASVVLCSSYFLCRNATPVCSRFGGQCGISTRDAQTYLLAVICSLIKSRRARSVWERAESVFFFCKVVNVVLFFQWNVRLFVLYTLALLVAYLSFNKGPIAREKHSHLLATDGKGLEVRLQENAAVLVVFVATWSPRSQEAIRLTEGVASRWSNSRLKFCRVDISSDLQTARKYRVNNSVTSKDLPVFVLFKEGSEVKRRSSATSLQWTESGIVDEFRLAEIGIGM